MRFVLLFVSHRWPVPSHSSPGLYPLQMCFLSIFMFFECVFHVLFFFFFSTSRVGKKFIRGRNEATGRRLISARPRGAGAAPLGSALAEALCGPPRARVAGAKERPRRKEDARVITAREVRRLCARRAPADASRGTCSFQFSRWIVIESWLTGLNSEITERQSKFAIPRWKIARMAGARRKGKTR